MGATDRIPVSEETQLQDLKKLGQTYDELLRGLIVERNRRELAEKARKTREMDADDLVPLNE